jgi:hypothetical protein
MCETVVRTHTEAVTEPAASSVTVGLELSLAEPAER